ncbi:glycine cleavage H-protein-domain-containing protein [Emericellopsis atlantica]|uniref:Glycine cleavage system H protein n=1 Tax=Emericellopsis atlantica TaxID=2614577 RepID=A0A9P7ZJK1_9HYPO|nr:glycine cleavage H-protein-domain-containing protein [Emericellopsis atlantica]KAG9252872.1 glycine cleavage H-protein-domain-containing protein [Emericellopsis atlantica]
MASISRSLRPVAMRLAPRATPTTARTAFRTFSTTRMTALRKYTKDHEWIDLSADQKTGVVGISEYAAEQLGDVVYVELPEESGSWIEQGDGIGAVESVKSASDINAPVRLKIVSVNKLLEEKPSTINKVPEDDSHGGGWVAKVEVDEAGAQQVEALMDAEAYKTFAAGDE